MSITIPNLVKRYNSRLLIHFMMQTVIKSFLMLNIGEKTVQNGFLQMVNGLDLLKSCKTSKVLVITLR